MASELPSTVQADRQPSSSPATLEPLLRMENITKSFPGVQALSGVSLEVRPGECLGLVGENGAGKSTLMKVLAGVHHPDSGRLLMDGKPVHINGPRHAQHLGIAIIYQEFNLCPNLSVEANVFIGREPSGAGFIHANEMRRQTRALLDQLGVQLDPTATVRDLSVADQQMVEIAKALSLSARLVIMDEPTSALSDTEVGALMEIIAGLKEHGLAVIYISHRLDEVFTICDRITVLRDGRNAGDVRTEAASPEQIVRMMVGRELDDLFRKGASGGTGTGKPVLEVRGLSREPAESDTAAIALRDINLALRPGEIVGLAGLVGSGRTELARAIFGADPSDRGEILIDGEPVQVRSPREAIRHGIGLVPEDRKAQALILGLTVRENISLANLGRLARFGLVRLGLERQLVREFVERLRIRTPSVEQRVLNLSGGNQQKVVIAKWLALRPRVLIMDEPTRGIDIGAKAEVHGLMHELTKDGVAILMISSELPEILGMSDRILVMRQGSIAGELMRREADQERIMALATGVDLKRSAA